MDKNGYALRSKASAGEGPGISTCVATRPTTPSEDASTLRSKSSRSSLESKRLRAEYEAEKELAMVKEQLIKKKLALEIAELEEEEEEERRLSVCGGSETVEKWLHNDCNAPLEQAAPEPSGSHGTTCFDTNPPHIPHAPAPPARPAPVNAATPALLAPVAVAPVASSDIMHLANVIMSISKQKPGQLSDLPVFDGNPVDWLAYRRAYETTAPSYNKYENTLRIQTSLRSAAKSAVEDILRTGSDPVDVINALEEEFGHPNLLLETALNKIKNLPPVSESGVELRHITSVVRNCVYILKNIKADGYLNNPQITHEILSKLTSVQRSQYGEFAMKFNSDRKCVDLRISPNLNLVLEFLCHITRASAYYLPLNSGTRIKSGADTPHHRRRDTHRVHTSVELPDEASASKSSASIKCELCDKNHMLSNCDLFMKKSVNERWDFIKVKKLCFKCLIRQHSRYKCDAKRCVKCRAPHHVLLHYVKANASGSGSGDGHGRVAPALTVGATPNRAGVAPALGAAPALRSAPAYAVGGASPALAGAAVAHGLNTTVSAESVTSMGERCTKTLLKILPVNVTIDNIEHTCYCLLDDGATVSLIDSSLCPKVNGQLLPLKIISARGNIVMDDQSCKVTALIRGPNGVNHNIVLRTLKNIDLPPQNVPARVIDRNTHLKELGFCEMECAKPMILLGQDNWELIVNQDIRRGKSGQPVASLTKLGWVVHGPMGVPSESVSESVHFLNDDLHDLVKEQFDLESIGITEISRKNTETERANKILKNTSCRVESGWEVGLLWDRDDVHLPDNFDYTFKRLQGVENRMDKDSKYAAAYTRQIERLITENYAKQVNCPMNVHPVWWLPHFGVTNPNKPGKLRLVFDAAAKCQGVCLNDFLLTGPDLLNSLLGVLFKFRTGPIAYTADIADMFLRVKIRKEDQGAQLFLWRGSDRVRDPDMYVMDSMIFGAKSSPSSAIYILNKNASEFQESYPEAVKAIHENHYMDDYLDSVQSVDMARQLINDVSMIHAAGGFAIRDWVTNSPELRKELPTVVPGTVNFDKSPNSGERTLGMIWVPESDNLAFDLSFKRLSPEIVAGRVVPTKRDFLKFIMSIFDPLGFLCPYTIKSKILLQKVWRSGIGWDEKLKESEFRDWLKWLQDIKQLVDIRVPRWYGMVSEAYDLHVFGDASELAYSAVAFLVSQDALGNPTVAMVAGKARVTPLRVVSVPRLELQAAVLACRLACTIEKEQGLPIVRKYLWSDSKTVLKWIHSDPRDFQKFVSHRLAEIDRKSNTADWRWVPSSDNPADEATKMHWPTSCKLWHTGPAFLYRPKDQWPLNEFADGNDVDMERLEKVHVVRQYEPLIDVTRFSSWTRAVRTMAQVLAFVGMCRKKQKSLTSDNMKQAELFLLKESQAETFSEELKLLSSGSVLPKGSKIRDLDPFVYEGIIRVRGRLSAASDLTFDEKHPIILDGHSRTAQLLVLHYHKRVHHANHETVINMIREKFWITQLRRTVKSVVSKCQFCRVRRVLPSAPKMSDLPAARLENTRRAFVHCGIDYFGPMDVAIGRRREKRWGVIFTCLVTRAVHIELAASLTADSAIMAIRRFVSRRGQPAVMFSDRGTNFISADAELRAALRKVEHDKIYDYVTTKGISWRFNVPAGPHMGGCWERLIRSIKNALRVTLKERAPKEEILLTVLAEVEMTINSRPLTYVGTDVDDPIALTPNHLLLGTASGAPTLGCFDASDLLGRKVWKKAQALADIFWQRWLKEYVPTLQRRQKWHDGVPPIKVGDAVLIFDDNQPRNSWPRGIISAVHPGRDGHVRIVTIKTCKGYLKRPVVKVAVLPTDA